MRQADSSSVRLTREAKLKRPFVDHRKECCVFKRERGSPERAVLSEEEGSNLPVARRGAEAECQVSFHLVGRGRRGVYQVTSKSRLTKDPSQAGTCICLIRGEGISRQTKALQWRNSPTLQTPEVQSPPGAFRWSRSPPLTGSNLLTVPARVSGVTERLKGRRGRRACDGHRGAES